MSPNTPSSLGSIPASDPNRLGLLFRAEAPHLPWQGRIIDAHTHIADVEAAEAYFAVAQWFNVERTCSQTPLEQVDAIDERFPGRLAFVAVPDYHNPDKRKIVSRDWLERIERFAEKGVKLAKFWAAPRGLEIVGPDMRLDSSIRLEAMRLAHRLGMNFMVHVADPDTWFATHYRDRYRFGTKPEHYEPLERLLDRYSDVKWLAAHMAGHPEDLDHVQRLLDRYPHLHVDTSATKWMVRELSKQPQRFAEFCRANPGRVLFGTDIVATRANRSETLYASRFWSLRTMLETDYEGPSPIVDPDLPLIDPAMPPDATATLRGANLDSATLAMLYTGAAERFFGSEASEAVAAARLPAAVPAAGR